MPLLKVGLPGWTGFESFQYQWFPVNFVDGPLDLWVIWFHGAPLSFGLCLVFSMALSWAYQELR
jgi:hypothetical protein